MRSMLAPDPGAALACVALDALLPVIPVVAVGTVMPVVSRRTGDGGLAFERGKTLFKVGRNGIRRRRRGYYRILRFCGSVVCLFHFGTPALGSCNSVAFAASIRSKWKITLLEICATRPNLSA